MWGGFLGRRKPRGRKPILPQKKALETRLHCPLRPAGPKVFPLPVNSSEATALLPYCPDLYRYQRRKTRVVQIGKVAVGGDHPIRVQSMLTSDTRDTGACV